MVLFGNEGGDTINVVASTNPRPSWAATTPTTVPIASSAAPPVTSSPAWRHRHRPRLHRERQNIAGFGNDLLFEAAVGSGNDLVFANEGNDSVKLNRGRQRHGLRRPGQRLGGRKRRAIRAACISSMKATTGGAARAPPIVGGNESADGSDSIARRRQRQHLRQRRQRYAQFGDRRNDTVIGGFGTDTILASVGTDFIFGDESNDTTLTVVVALVPTRCSPARVTTRW